MKIDAHQHFWALSRGDYGWLTPELLPIYRDFGPDDLAPCLKRCRITKTIVVQAAPTETETDYLLRIAAGNDMVAGVVGWTDMEANCAADRIEVLASNRLLVGLRPMLHDLADDYWILRAANSYAIEAMLAEGLVLDVLVRPRHLLAIIALARRHAGLRIVVDHAAKPDVARRNFEPWRQHMTELAREDNVFVKLSGLVTEAAPGWQIEDLAPYCDHLLHAFGPERMLWGSDWPVLTLASTYERWHAASEVLLAGVEDHHRSAIFGGTASRVYLASRGRI